MPKGCKTITMFLTDDELRQITPQQNNTNPHCKITNFHQPFENTVNIPENKSRKKLTRRLTCSSVPEFMSEKSSQSPSNIPEQNFKRYLKSNKVNSYNTKQNAFGIEQSTWGKNSFKSKMRLSHVPLVECRGGESPLVDDVIKLGNSSVDSNFGKTYQQLELSQHLDSFALNASGDASQIFKHHSAKKGLDEKHSVSNNTEHTNNASLGSINGKRNGVSKDTEYNNDITANGHIQKSKSEVINKQNLNAIASTADSLTQSKDKAINLDDTSTPNHVIVNGESAKEENISDTENVDIVGTKVEIHVDRSEQIINEIETKENISKNIDVAENKVKEHNQISDETTSVNDSVKHNNQIIKAKEKNSKIHGQNGADPKSYMNYSGSNLNETDSGCFEVSLKENPLSISPIKQDCKIIISRSTRVFSESEIETEDEADIVRESFVPCIACLDINSDNSAEFGSSQSKCEKCEGQLVVKQVINKSGEKQEVMDFKTKTDGMNSDTDAEAQSDIEGRHFYTAKSEALTDKTGLSSFSSDVSTDSSISRYWTYEMEGLNDVTVYVQCHSEISLLLIMENPEQYEENLFHALWKGSLNHLADLDYHITESLENEESMENDVSYKFARFDAFSSELNTNIDDVPTKRRDAYQQQMLSVLHSDFRDRHCLTDVTLRSHLACCYGHHREGEETFFQPELPNRGVSGLPTTRDPAFNLETVAKKRLAEEKKITML